MRTVTGKCFCNSKYNTIGIGKFVDRKNVFLVVLPNDENIRGKILAFKDSIIV